MIFPCKGSHLNPAIDGFNTFQGDLQKFQGVLPPTGVDAKSPTVVPGLGRQVRGHRCRNVLWLGLTLCFGSTPERSGANSRRR